ncbi:hypothetical protein HPB47_001252, partial [Ixodes persulcatus]
SAGDAQHSTGPREPRGLSALPSGHHGPGRAAADVLGPGQAVARVPLPPASPVDPELAIDLGPGFPANQDPRRGPRTGAPVKTRVVSRWCALPGPAWEARLEPSLESGSTGFLLPITDQEINVGRPVSKIKGASPVREQFSLHRHVFKPALLSPIIRGLITHSAAADKDSPAE